MKLKKLQMQALRRSIGRDIQAARENLKMTQHALSQATGISVGNISNIERGKVMPSLPILLPLVKNLGLSMDRMIKDV